MRLLGLTLVATLASACATADLGDVTQLPDYDGPADGWGASADPLLMPKSIVTYVNDHHWGTMHIQWHTERRWNLLPAASLAYAKKQGWTKAPLQEGAKGNGIEFLAMHRMMMQMLVELYPTTKKYFVGWTEPPTAARDKHDPLPHGATDAFDPEMAMALDTLQNNLAEFKTDDELGLFIETSLRPTASQPSARATDKTAGIHNYIHNRFQDPSSTIDIGDPTVNLQNKRFWRLHGWIDAVWTEYRAQQGLTDDDPIYSAAMKQAMAEMPMDSDTKGLGAEEGDAPPDELLQALLAP